MLEIAYATDMSAFRALLLEYAAATGLDLEFQGFSVEVATLPGHYDPILCATWNGEIAGAVALRDLGDGICEMKRLYVRPAFRKTGAGRALVTRLIEEARARGYRAMRLDTLPTMHDAMRLYESLGFRDIDAYCFNPVEGTRFMELQLSS